MKINIPFQFAGTGKKLEAFDTLVVYHYLKHLQRFRFRSEFRTEKLCVTLLKRCVTLRLKSARQNYQNVLSIGIYSFL